MARKLSIRNQANQHIKEGNKTKRKFSFSNKLLLRLCFLYDPTIS